MEIFVCSAPVRQDSSFGTEWLNFFMGSACVPRAVLRRPAEGPLRFDQGKVCFARARWSLCPACGTMIFDGRRPEVLCVDLIGEVFVARARVVENPVCGRPAVFLESASGLLKSKSNGSQTTCFSPKPGEAGRIRWTSPVPLSSAGPQ